MDINDDQYEKLFHKTIQCYVHGCEYSFVTKKGILYIGEHSCTDMSGAINFFKKIDKKVNCIEIRQGEKLDMFYAIVKGDWKALRYKTTP